MKHLLGTLFLLLTCEGILDQEYSLVSKIASEKDVLIDRVTDVQIIQSSGQPRSHSTVIIRGIGRINNSELL